MNDAIEKRLELCTSLPSLPTAAIRILELARDASAGLGQIAEAVKMDPALAAKVLRMANSALYARRRKCESFQQALVLLGLNATVTLALTFSLAATMKAEAGRGLDYSRVWRRALLAATSARILGEHLFLPAPEELFLAALLQDIGMLALDSGYPELYQALNSQEQEHDRAVALERSHLGCDHAEVGAWLLARWNLPERFRTAVADSHRSQFPDSDQDEARAGQCLSVSGAIADLWLAEDAGASLDQLRFVANDIPDLDGDALAAVIDRVAEAAPEIEQLFEMELLDKARSEWILNEAREVIVLRNLQMVQESSKLREVAASLQVQARMLEEKTRRDKLTGAFNRGHLDQTLSDWFADANKEGLPISVVFADLDNFKQINDIHGHHSGDQVLKKCAKLLQSIARDTDLVARYGGEEFVILLPGCANQGAIRVCERLLTVFRATNHELNSTATVRVTCSFGVATHSRKTRFSNCEHMLRCADAALYQAKQAGKDRFVEYQFTADAA